MNSSINTTHLPNEVWQQIEEQSAEVRLWSILDDHYIPAPEANNTRAYRQFNAAKICADEIVETTPPMYAGLVTLTTSWRCAKQANQRLSRILEKVIAPHCSKWIRFFHRSRNGYVHWHIIVALKSPVLNTGHDAWVSGEIIRQRLSMRQSMMTEEEALESALSDETKLMRDGCRAALRKAGLGYRVWVQPIFHPDAIASYASRYLLGTSRGTRYPKDARIRLWSVSKHARVANSHVHMVSWWSRISRLRNAAYCASRGWRTMEQAREADSNWQYHSREILRGQKLRTYLHEADYVLEWGNRWSPQASVVRRN